MNRTQSDPAKTNGNQSHREDRQGFQETFKRDGNQPVWTYRGYSLQPSDFNTAMVHLYRGEVNRSNVWRQRLDATTNWAVITTGATLTIAFNLNFGHHTAIILNTLLVTLFLYIEARRYLYYELWTSRVRLMETDFFAAMLVPPFRPDDDWAEGMATSLLHPHFPISMWEGFGRRFRRNYIWIYFILAISWVIRVGLFPEPAATLGDFFARSAIGSIPGWLTVLVGVVFNGLLFLIGLATTGLHKTTGEVLPHFFSEHEIGYKEMIPQKVRAWYRSSRRRHQLLAHIISNEADAVAEGILTEMQRGVTHLPGTGMFSGKSLSVLLCAVTETEVSKLKNVVHSKDARAFVVISPVKEILGEGFGSLNLQNG